MLGGRSRYECGEREGMRGRVRGGGEKSGRKRGGRGGRKGEEREEMKGGGNDGEGGRRGVAQRPPALRAAAPLLHVAPMPAKPRIRLQDSEHGCMPALRCRADSLILSRNTSCAIYAHAAWCCGFSSLAVIDWRTLWRVLYDVDNRL